MIDKRDVRALTDGLMYQAKTEARTEHELNLLASSGYGIVILKTLNRIIDGLNEASEERKLILTKINALEKRGDGEK